MEKPDKPKAKRAAPGQPKLKIQLRRSTNTLNADGSVRYEPLPIAVDYADYTTEAAVKADNMSLTQPTALIEMVRNISTPEGRPCRWRWDRVNKRFVVTGNSLKKTAGTQEFQELAERSFDAYRKAGIAYLEAMPVPMYPTGIQHPRTHQPLFAPKGTSPFDAYGFWGQDATMIGAEFKATSHREASLSISDSGLREHQLDALALLAQKGGIARLVWSNAGQVGVLWGEKIVQAHATFLDAKRTEARPGCKAQLGSKSIKWEEFKIIEPTIIAGIPCYDWLLHQYIMRGAGVSAGPMDVSGPSTPPNAQ